MSTIDEQFIEYIVKSLVGNPDAVVIDRRVDEKGVLLELTVDPEDLGRIIGKRGATAQSLRTLLRALGTKNEARYNLKIVDNGPQQDRPERPAREDAPSGAAPADDDQSQDDTSAPADEPTETVMVDEPEAVEEDDTNDSDRMSKTRRELADLDDLDI